jgi:transposase-like protein
MSQRKKRRIFSPEQKSKAVVRHLQDGVAISTLCDELEILPTQFYDWQKQALSGLPRVFESQPNKISRSQTKEIEDLQTRLTQKDSVIAELLEEHITLKKSLGVS